MFSGMPVDPPADVLVRNAGSLLFIYGQREGVKVSASEKIKWLADLKETSIQTPNKITDSLLLPCTRPTIDS